MRIKKIPDKIWEMIYSQVPRFCIDLLILNEDGGVLLTKRAINPSKGAWHFPGGTLYFGEGILECASRIAKEELGTTIRLGKFVGVEEYINEDVGDYRRHSISVIFEAKIIGNSPALNEEASEFRFFKNALPKETQPTVRNFLLKHGYVRAT